MIEIKITGGFVMAYLNFAIGTILGLCFVIFGAMTIIDECKFVKKFKV